MMLVRTEQRLSCPTCTGWVFTMLSFPPTMPAPSPRSVHHGCAPLPTPPPPVSLLDPCIFWFSEVTSHDAYIFPKVSSHDICILQRSNHTMFTQYIFPQVSLHNVYTIYLHQDQFTPCLYLPQGQFTQCSHRISSPGSFHTMLVSSTRSVHTKYHHQGQFTQCFIILSS